MLDLITKSPLRLVYFSFDLPSEAHSFKFFMPSSTSRRLSVIKKIFLLNENILKYLLFFNGLFNYLYHMSTGKSNYFLLFRLTIYFSGWQLFFTFSVQPDFAKNAAKPLPFPFGFSMMHPPEFHTQKAFSYANPDPVACLHRFIQP